MNKQLEHNLYHLYVANLSNSKLLRGRWMYRCRDVGMSSSGRATSTLIMMKIVTVGDARGESKSNIIGIIQGALESKSA